MIKRILLLLVLYIGTVALFSHQTYAQGYEPYNGGLKIPLKGENYIRFITWHQIQLETTNIGAETGRVENNLNLRRTRMIAFAELFDKKFLVITHFGANNIRPNTMNAVGTSSQVQLFMHDVWGEAKVIPGKLNIGAGLHYWNGLSRLNMTSTLNFMTLDNPRFGWNSIGTTSQFARHLGAFAKGTVGKIHYDINVSQPIWGSNSFVLDSSENGGLTTQIDNEGEWMVGGYVNYFFFDKESDFLPFRVGTYLGTKKVFNIGAGFQYMINGSARFENINDPAAGIENFDHNHFAVDAFLELPLGDSSLAINGKAAFMSYNYGENYVLNSQVATGNYIYFDAGLLLPEFSDKFRLMPYIAGDNRDFEGFDNAGNSFGVGLNSFFAGHHTKLTLEFRSDLAPHSGDAPDRANRLTTQFHVYF